jgi:hypothetical protein
MQNKKRIQITCCNLLTIIENRQREICQISKGGFPSYTRTAAVCGDGHEVVRVLPQITKNPKKITRQRIQINKERKKRVEYLLGEKGFPNSTHTGDRPWR